MIWFFLVGFFLQKKIRDVGCSFQGSNISSHEKTCHFLAIREQLLPVFDELSSLRAQVQSQKDEIRKLQIDARPPALSPEFDSAPPIPGTLELPKKPPRRQQPPQPLPTAPQLTRELFECQEPSLRRYEWYYGSIAVAECEAMLRDQPGGTFLVRDSKRTAGAFAFAVSNGKTGRPVWAVAKPHIDGKYLFGDTKRRSNGIIIRRY